jgi:methyl-accepting chemotaxis protein
MSFAAIVFFNICFGAYAIYSLSVINYRVQDANSWTVGLWQVDDILFNATMASRMEMRYLMLTDPEKANAVKEGGNAFARSAEDVMNVYRSDVLTIPYDTEEQRQEDLIAIDAIIDRWGKYKEASSALIALHDQNRFQEAISLVDGEFSQRFDDLKEAALALSKYNLDGSALGVELSEQVYSSTRRIIYAVLLFVTAFSVLVTFFLTRGIKRSTDELLRVSEAVGNGDLTVRARVFSRDDLGRLCERYNDTIASIKSLISRIHESAEQLVSATNRLNDLAAHTAEEGAIIESSMEKTSLQTGTQLTEIESMTATIQAMSVSVLNETSIVTSLTGAAQESVEKSRVGEQSIERAVEEMGRLEEAVEASAQVVTSLGERSGEIGQIVATITGISSQTNLLALNAAIEAARAGEHGRGFAVVAEEVKKLAGESRAAADEISKLIASIQGETNSAVDSMKLGMDAAEKGSENMRSLGAVFNELIGVSVNSASSLQDVVGVMHGLSSDMSTIVEAARNVENASRVIAEDSRSVVAATEDQTASVTEFSTASQNLADIAVAMLETANQFTI